MVITKGDEMKATKITNTILRNCQNYIALDVHENLTIGMLDNGLKVMLIWNDYKSKNSKWKQKAVSKFVDSIEV